MRAVLVTVLLLAAFTVYAPAAAAQPDWWVQVCHEGEDPCGHNLVCVLDKFGNPVACVYDPCSEMACF